MCDGGNRLEDMNVFNKVISQLHNLEVTVEEEDQVTFLSQLYLNSMTT